MQTILINDKKLENLVIEGSFELPYFNIDIDTQDVPGRTGSVKLERTHKELRFNLPLVYVNERAKKSTDEIMKLVTNFIDYEKPVSIQMSDEDWLWYGYITGPINLKPFNKSYQEFEVGITLIDPHRYSVDTFKNTASSDSVTVVNNGTATTPILVEATALENSPYFMITDVENHHFMIGDDDEDKVLKNYRPQLLHDEFRSLSGWRRLPADDNIKGILGGKTGGTFNQNIESWNLDKTSHTSGWHGAAYLKSFPRSAQDFETTYKFSVHNDKQGLTRLGQYIFDDKGRQMISLGYTETAESSNNGLWQIVLYDEQGNIGKTILKINVPAKLKKVRRMITYIKLSRVGTKYSVRLWVYDDESDPWRTKEVVLYERNIQFFDEGKFYQRKVASVVQGTFVQGKKKLKYAGQLGTFIYELLEKPADARDYIIQKGDTILLNTREKVISVNGEPMLKEKSFSSNFFNIDSGLTNLLISPEETFDTTVKWRDRYK